MHQLTTNTIRQSPRHLIKAILSPDKHPSIPGLAIPDTLHDFRASLGRQILFADPASHTLLGRKVQHGKRFASVADMRGADRAAVRQEIGSVDLWKGCIWHTDSVRIKGFMSVYFAEGRNAQCFIGRKI